MKHLLIIFLTLSASAFAQTEVDYKDYLVDSLRKSGVDTILVVENSCYNCGRAMMDKSNRVKPCFFGATYSFIWMRNNHYYFKEFDNCYETSISESKSSEWITHYLNNWKELTEIQVIQSDSIIIIHQDTIFYSRCADQFETPIFDYLPNDSYMRFELYIGNKVYPTGEITNNLLCHLNTKNRKEIKVMFRLISTVCDAYLYNPDFLKNKKPTQLKRLE